MTLPSSQWFGSGLGHIGSTSNFGACTDDLPCAADACCSMLWATPSVASTATNVAPTKRLRLLIPLIFCLRLSSPECRPAHSIHTRGSVGSVGSVGSRGSEPRTWRTLRTLRTSRTQLSCLRGPAHPIILVDFKGDHVRLIPAAGPMGRGFRACAAVSCARGDARARDSERRHHSGLHQT